LLGEPLVLGEEVERRVEQVVGHLLATGVLDADGEMLQIGPEAERRYGKRNYLDLTAVFADPPTLAVVHGRTSLGQIHIRSLPRRPHDEPAAVLIAGRDWDIEHVDWRRRLVEVVPAKRRRGRSQWLGAGPGQSMVLAQATRKALAGADPAGVTLSKWAAAGIAELRGSLDWLREPPSADVVRDPDGTTWWWTFGGTAGNVELASVIGPLAPTTPASGLAIRLADGTAHAEVMDRLRRRLEEPPPVTARRPGRGVQVRRRPARGCCRRRARGPRP
jgi:ATP-dependent Lhr-like helicase